jgi:hypothetical protein
MSFRAEFLALDALAATPLHANHKETTVIQRKSTGAARAATSDAIRTFRVGVRQLRRR